MQTLSEAGLQAIKLHEGLRLKAYQDQAGHWTIGWGHISGVREGDEIPRSQAVAYLLRDVANAERCVRRACLRVLNQNQFDALVSLVFNIGCGGFTSSTLLKNLNSGDLVGVAMEFPKWNKITDPKTKEKKVSKGLVNRRAAELVLFQTPVQLSEEEMT